MNTDPDPAKVCRSDLIQIRLSLHLGEMNTDLDPASDADPFGFGSGSTALVLSS
jgi:hypothetical protein